MLVTNKIHSGQLFQKESAARYFSVYEASGDLSQQEAPPEKGLLFVEKTGHKCHKCSKFKLRSHKNESGVNGMSMGTVLIDCKENLVQLHRDLYSYSQGAAGGSYKNSDNVIAETDAEGHQKARFTPVPAFQTAQAMEELCTRFLEAWEADHIEKIAKNKDLYYDALNRAQHGWHEGTGNSTCYIRLK